MSILDRFISQSKITAYYLYPIISPILNNIKTHHCIRPEVVDSRALAESVFAGTGAVFRQSQTCDSYRLATLLHLHDVQNWMKSQANLAYTRKQ